MATMHLLIVADTHDFNIGESVEVDIERVHRHFLEYSSLCDMWLSVRTLHGEKFEKEQIMNAVREIHVLPDDMIFFYYSGHGHRNESKIDPWPLMSIGINEFGQFKGFDTKWIYQMLRHKIPRLLVMMTDSCQAIVPNEQNETITSYSSRGGNRVDSCRKLFKECRGEVLLISCDPGEYSYGNPQLGGFYSHRVFTALENALSTPNPSWENIARNSQEIPSVDQNPIWRVTTGSIWEHMFAGSSNDLENWVRSKGMSRASKQQEPASSTPASTSYARSPHVSGHEDRMQALRERTEQRLQKGPASQSTASFCTECGAPLRSRFCGKCGTRH